MKTSIFILIFIILIGCSTIPQEYKVEPNESEIMYIESGAVLGSVFTILVAGYIYWYSDNLYNYWLNHIRDTGDNNMALKDARGRYYRIHGIFVDHGKIELRIARNYTEEERQEEPEEAKFYNESGLVLSEELRNQILDMIYPVLKAHKTNVRTVKHPAVISDMGKVTKKAYTEELFDSPYLDMIDC